MLDPATITALAASAVTALVPLLHKMAEKGAEELGKSAIGGLIDKFKRRLTHDGAKEALDDLIVLPADAAAQGALSMQLISHKPPTWQATTTRRFKLPGRETA